jgi:hypothetical protein
MRKTQPSLTDLRNGRLASKLGNQTSLKSSEILVLKVLANSNRWKN